MFTFALPKKGEVTEWPIVHAWKACVPKGTPSSNLGLSAEGDSLQMLVESPFLFLLQLSEKERITVSTLLVFRVRSHYFFFG